MGLWGLREQIHSLKIKSHWPADGERDRDKFRWDHHEAARIVPLLWQFLCCYGDLGFQVRKAENRESDILEGTDYSDDESVAYLPLASLRSLCPAHATSQQAGVWGTMPPRAIEYQRKPSLSCENPSLLPSVLMRFDGSGSHHPSPEMHSFHQFQNRRTIKSGLLIIWPGNFLGGWGV